MATVGQPLTAPENGWRRFDNLDSNISYLGSGWYDDPTYQPYLGSRKVGTGGASIHFNFTGSNLRIIGPLSYNWSNNVQISVDGITESFNQYAATITPQVLNYEKINLSNTEHSVVITNTGSKDWGLDAIDIDNNGELKPYNPNITPYLSAPANLTATAGDSKVSLSWNSVTDATGYNVKRFTTLQVVHTQR